MGGSGAIPLSGHCDPAFEPVREAFVANFEQRGEHGAALCVVVGDSVVVDLVGGWADAARSTPWPTEGLVNLFSVGKAFAAVCVARLVGEGRLGLDDPVAEVWPEFAAHGKNSVTVRQLLAHRAGLPAVRRRLPPEAMLDHRLMAEALAAEEPWWPPGTAHGYHTNTFGFLVGELVRRVDGRTLGTVLGDDVAGPLGAEIFIGLPEREHDRVVDFLWPGVPAPEAEPAGLSRDQLMEFNAYSNPSGLSGAGVVNTARWRRAEIPSTNGHGSARGVARLYQALAHGGVADGVRVVEEGLLAFFTEEQANGEDLILHRPSRFGVGFQLTQPERPLGPGARAFGHFGAGGSLGYCDPERGLALGYLINQMGPRWQNPRNRALIDAVSRVLG